MTDVVELAENWTINDKGQIERIALAPERVFSSGAKRDSETTKLDFDGSLSPYALEALASYMSRHNNQAHRAEDNWKLGIPLRSFMKSLWRHFHHAWKLHYSDLSDEKTRLELIDALAGIWFNTQGYLHELTKPEPKMMLNEFILEKKGGMPYE